MFLLTLLHKSSELCVWLLKQHNLLKFINVMFIKMEIQTKDES